MTQLIHRHDTFAGLIGVARGDITPPLGIYNRNWGAATTDVATGIHRPLTATALVLKSDATGARPLTLLSLDLGWWRTIEDEWDVRGAVCTALGLDERHVLLHLTHTHAGPCICREDDNQPGGHLVGPYLDHVKAVCVEIAREATHNASLGRLDWSYGKCVLAHNRDLPDPSGPLQDGRQHHIVCGFNPGRPGDDTLLIGRATDTTGRIKATLVNYALHPVTLAWQNQLISPDFVGAMREVVEAHTGSAPCLFLQGASGELAPMQEYTGDVTIADRNGRALGMAALSVLESMLPPGKHMRYEGAVESGAPLATWGIVDAGPLSPSGGQLDARIIRVELGLKSNLPTLDEIESQLAAATDTFQIERLRRRRRLRRVVGDGSTASTSVWLWRIGETLLIANPNEAYSQLQTELRRRFPNHTIAVLNITNGGYAYLPPRELFGLDQYQVWQTPYAPGCLEQTIEECANAIVKLAG